MRPRAPTVSYQHLESGCSVHACAFNLSLLMRMLTGIGTPRSLQGRVAAAVTLDLTFGGRLANRVAAWRSRWGDPSPFFATDYWHVQPAVAA